MDYKFKLIFNIILSTLSIKYEIIYDLRQHKPNPFMSLKFSLLSRDAEYDQSNVFQFVHPNDLEI